MARADDAEVAPVKRGDFRLVQAFGDGDDGRIDEADVLVGVSGAEFSDSQVVIVSKLGNDQPAPNDLRQQSLMRTSPEPPLNEVVKLNQNRRRNDETLRGTFEQRPALAMMSVPAVHRSKEYVRINNERQEVSLLELRGVQFVNPL